MSSFAQSPVSFPSRTNTGGSSGVGNVIRSTSVLWHAGHHLHRAALFAESIGDMYWDWQAGCCANAAIAAIARALAHPGRLERSESLTSEWPERDQRRKLASMGRENNLAI